MKLELFGLTEIPLIVEGDNIAELILHSLKQQDLKLDNGDILLICETLISKAEGNYINLKKINPSSEAYRLADKCRKEPKIIEAILNESTKILAIGPNFIISETKHGFICANAGIDESNVEKGLATPLPKNPDKTAQKINNFLKNEAKRDLAVIITDTQGRAFRNGAVGIAIGCNGLSPLWKKKGEKDLYDKKLETTETAVADELAAAASLLMGQSNEKIPAVLTKGFTNFNTLKNKKSTIKPLLRKKESDVFRKKRSVII